MEISTPVKTRKDLIGQRFGRLIVDQISIRRGRVTEPKPGSKRPGLGPKDQAYWLCVCDCGGIKRVRAADLTRGSTRSCGCLRRETNGARLSARGPAHPAYRTGLNSHGYRNFREGGKYKLEHRVVMEELLGRSLLPGESVHHINGVRHDNRPENLELWSTSQPKGQRVEDKVQWALDLLRLYDPERLVDHVRR